MSLTTKRRLPDVNHQKNRLEKPVLYKTEIDSRDVQHNLHLSKSTMSPVEKSRNNARKTRKISPTKHRFDANDLSKQDSTIEEVQLNFDRQLQEIKRKLTTPISNDEDGIPRAYIESNRYRSDFQLSTTKRSSERFEFKTQHDSTNLRECAKSIRESVTHFMRNEIPKDEGLSSLLTRRRRTGSDHRQIENDYLIHQQTILSKSATLNEMLSFKKELERSERQREQLAEQLESVIKTSNEKEKLVFRSLIELKEMTENCDTFERQNTKLQHDLTLALEKLEEMTEEAERFAQESSLSQKQLADSEQKREEFQIQSQETTKQWNARVKKLEKDIDRYKLESTQMSEKQEQLIKENETYKSHNFTLKEQNIKIETDLNEANTNSKQVQEQFKQNENTIVHLRSIQSSQEEENATLKGTINELENQLSIYRQRLSQNEKENQHLQEEIKHRNHLHSKLKQSEQDIERLNISCSQLQNERKDLLQTLKEIQFEKDLLIQEKSKFLSLENDYAEIKKKLETTKMDYTRGMKALQMDYENKIETFQLQLSDEKSQNTISERHLLEHKKEIERLREKSAKYEDENTQGQCTIETFIREISDKTRFINELESKLTKQTTEITNQRNEILKKEKDYQNSLQIIYQDINSCTECLSNDSNKPFVIEPATTPRDNLEIYSSKLKAHLAWLKQELEIRYEEENKLRQELNNALTDCETDRTYFAAEIAKREVIIDQLTHSEREYDQQRISFEDGGDRIDHRYRQIQTMIDSVKRELHTAKVELLA